MLQLLAAPVAALSDLQRLFEEFLRLHDRRGLFLGQENKRRRTTTTHTTDPSASKRS